MAGSVALSEAHGAQGKRGAAVAWVVPTYRNARAMWRFIERHAADYTLRRSELSVEFPSGGHVTVFTADNDVAMRGENFDIAIVDEAARIREETYTDVILPTLADRDGCAYLPSTPRGRNWFWREFQRGLNDGKVQASFTAPSNANPMPTIRAAFELARERVSNRTFRQEWLAEFVDDGGGVFRGVRALSTLTRLDPIPQRQYVIGVDWARTNDASVFSLWDTATGQEAALDRMTDTNYSLQIVRLKALADKYNGARVIAESNGLGDPLIEQAQRAGLAVTAFYTTNASKAHIIDGLALECEQGAITFQSDEAGILEMESFESSRTASGLVKYSAPEGLHDDVVMARAIARNAARMPTGSSLVSFG